MSEDGERDPWRWINRTSSLLTEKPYNGDLIGMLLSDGQIIRGRFEQNAMIDPARTPDWRIAGKWVREDGVQISADDPPVMWCDESDI
jgi:hypothetical protein